MMKSIDFKTCRWGIILFIIAMLTACTHSAAIPALIPSSQSSLTPELTSASSPTQSASTIPKDPELDQTCRTTITYFFSVDKSFKIEAVRNLFVASRQDLADAVIQRQSPLMVLQILPADEMWRKDHPEDAIPPFMLPEKENQYIYFVEYTGTYASNATEVVPYPRSMLVIVESTGPDDCKIENYGWG